MADLVVSQVEGTEGISNDAVRHQHAATSVEGSRIFRHYVERNRLIVHVKNAPWRYVGRAVLASFRETALYVRRDIVRPVIERRRPSGTFVFQRVRAFGAFAVRAPRAVMARRRLRRRQRIGDEELLRWVTRPD
jgi:hypothetical protein